MAAIRHRLTLDGSPGTLLQYSTEAVQHSVFKHKDKNYPQVAICIHIVHGGKSQPYRALLRKRGSVLFVCVERGIGNAIADNASSVCAAVFGSSLGTIGSAIPQEMAPDTGSLAADCGARDHQR